MPPPPNPPRPQHDRLELAVGYALILIVLWTPRPYQACLYRLAAAFLLFGLWRSFAGWPAMGLRLTNLLRSLWIVAAALALSAICILTAIHLHTLHPIGGPIAFLRSYWGYTLWSLVQQILLQDFFLQRLHRLLHKPNLAAFAAAGLFAAAHLPNPILTVVTLLWGWLACTLFLRDRNLYPLGLSHAIMGITLAIAIPGPVIRNMRVGLGYLQYSRHSFQHTGPPVRHPEGVRTVFPSRQWYIYQIYLPDISGRYIVSSLPWEISRIS